MSAPTPTAAIQTLILDHCAFLGRSAAACERAAARGDVACTAATEARRLRDEQALLEAIAWGRN